MKIAALIIGILAGLSGFPIATMGHALMGAGGGSGGSILYLLPIASFIGAGLALNLPAASGALLLGSAFFWFLLGAKAGYAINIITIAPLALNAVAGFLAVAAWGQENAASGNSNDDSHEARSFSNQTQIRDVSAQAFATNVGPTPTGSYQTYQYDQAKWQALVEYDPDIARVEAALQPYGRKYIDQFAAAYLTLNDKSYLPNIVQKVIETARQDAAEAKAAEDRWGKRFSDPAYVLKFAAEKVDFLMSAPFGNVAILKDNSVLLERNGQITRYPNASALREAANDRSTWPEITDIETKIRFVRVIAEHNPI